MNFKRVIYFSVLLILSAALLTPATYAQRSPRVAFAKDTMFLTPELLIISDTFPFGVNFEMGITKNVGVGGDVLLVPKDAGGLGLILSPDISFHVDLGVRKWDIFGGGGPALSINSKGELMDSGFSVKLFFGTRYLFSPRLAAYIKYLGLLGSDSHQFGGLALGISFNL